MQYDQDNAQSMQKFIFSPLSVQHCRPEEVGTDHVSDHALRFSSDVSMELMYRLSFCRNCESLHPGVGLNGKSS